MEVVPLKKAIGIILGVTFLISGSAALCLLSFKYIKQARVTDPKYDILAIVQVTQDNEPLKTAYLSELLNLSVDQPTNIYRFNVENAERQLLLSPLIKKAKIKKSYPGIIYIYYVARVPIAFLADFTNTAIDKEGVPIPFKPFFTPKILPEIYLGVSEERDDNFLGKPIKNRRMSLGLKLLKELSNHLVLENSRLLRIDVSQSFSQSYGQRQIVVVMEEKKQKLKNGVNVDYQQQRILRLSTTGYQKELKDYLKVRKYLAEKESIDPQFKLKESKVIDLRIPEIGIIKV